MSRCPTSLGEHWRGTSSRSSLSVVKIPRDFHGTFNGYSYHLCRCDRCVEANAVHQLEQTLARAVEIPEHVHGTENGYVNYRCRCDRCGVAHREKQLVYRERRRQKKATAQS